MRRPLELWGRWFGNGSTSLVAALFLASTLACRSPESSASLSLLTSLPPSDVEVLQKELHSVTASWRTVSVKVRSVPARVLEEATGAFTPPTESNSWDLALVPSSWLLRLEKRQAILEVPIHHVQRLSQAVSPLALLAANAQGKILGYPLSINVPVLFLNPQFFPEVPTSLAALVATPLPPGVFPLGLDLRTPSTVFPLLEGGKTTQGDQNVAAGTNALKELLAKLGPKARLTLQLWTVPYAESAQAQLFVEGKLAAFVGGPRAAALMETVKAPYLVVSIPPWCESCQAPKPWAQVTVVVVNSFCPFPDLAEKLALELTSPDRNVRLNLAMNTLPVVGGAEESEILAQNPFLFRFRRALDMATVMTLDETSETWQQWELALERFLADQTNGNVPKGDG